MCSNGFDEVHCPQVIHHAVEIAGTFQEYCVTDGRYATKIPDGVTDEETGPIMCGGFSAYAACKRDSAQPGEWLVVLGAGGGVGHFAVQEAYDIVPHTLRVRGTLVTLGIRNHPAVMAGTMAALVIGKRLNIVGSLFGTKREADEALDFAARGLIHPILTKGTLHDIDRFFDMLQEGSVPGRAMIKVSP
ncbi:hypothetical protein LB504_008054 [Fusarium proliferatum]|nr:hypothetical protein LB504_008054 [Fusarium proliferatum]